MPAMNTSTISRFLLAIGLLLFSGHGIADSSLEQILKRTDAPDGVVFEIVDSDEQALESILPRVNQAIKKIRNRFPKTKFAVVSHGREEFALQSRYQQSLPVIHQQVRSLVADDVPVHVCETHAGWYGVTAEDFPEYVDVAPTGPGQINAYLEMGYALILME